MEHHTLSLFNSGDKIGDLLPKYKYIIPSFNLIIIQIGSNNCLRKNEAVIPTKKQHLFEEICSVNANAQLFTILHFPAPTQPATRPAPTQPATRPLTQTAMAKEGQ